MVATIPAVTWTALRSPALADIHNVTLDGLADGQSASDRTGGMENGMRKPGSPTTTAGPQDSHAVREALAPFCTSVVTVAPAADCSGYARKATFARPVGVRRVSGGQHPVYQCDGTPTDCKVGGSAACTRGADLVVSGINHGANLADDVTNSGTVGAGLDIALLCTAAVCLSQQTPTGSFSVVYREDLRSPGRLRLRLQWAATARPWRARSSWPGPWSRWS